MIIDWFQRWRDARRQKAEEEYRKWLREVDDQIYNEIMAERESEDRIARKVAELVNASRG